MTQNHKFMMWIKNNYLAILIIILIPVPYLCFGDLFFSYGDMYGYVERALTFGSEDWAWSHRSGGRLNLFPLLMHLSFVVFGKNLISIKYLFTLLLIIILFECWFMGKLFFNNNSGLIAAILIGTSFTYTHFLFLPHIDFPLLMLMNICLIVLYICLKEEIKPGRWFFLSGLLIGSTFLFKQTVFLFIFIVPVFALLTNQYKNRELFNKWLIQIAGCLLVVIPSIIINYAKVLKISEKQIRKTNLVMSKANFIGRFFQYFLTPFENDLKFKHIMVSFDQVMIYISLIFFGLIKSEGRKEKLFLLATIITFTPWIIYQASRTGHYRQLLFPTFILFLMLGNVLFIFYEKITNKLKSKYNLLSYKTLLCLLLATIYFSRLFILSSCLIVYQEKKERAGLMPKDLVVELEKYLEINQRIKAITKNNEELTQKENISLIQLYSQAIDLRLHPRQKKRMYKGRAKVYKELGQYELAKQDLKLIKEIKREFR